MLRSKLLPTCCALALTLPACAENDRSLYVAGVLYGEAPECAYKADPSSQQRLEGVLDVGFKTSYDAVLLVALQLTPRGDKDKLRAESMFFQVRGAEVRLTSSTGELEDEFSVPAGGSITPITADNPGYGFSYVRLIHNRVGERLRNRLAIGQSRLLVADVRVFGETGGGTELTSGSFSYNITVCHGCLRAAIENGTDTDANGLRYCNTALSEPTFTSGCVPGQDDGYADCRLCQTSDCLNSPL
jgi:hypothetical protein